MRVLGYGEITLVVGWPSDDPVVAVKRLPPFSDARRLGAYADLLHRYLGILEDRGVAVVETELRSTSGPVKSTRCAVKTAPASRHSSKSSVARCARIEGTCDWAAGRWQWEALRRRNGQASP